MRRRVPTRRLLLAVVAVPAAAVVVLNWTYGRLPAEPKPSGSFVQVGKLRIHYLERPGSGTPVVLIHGLPGTAEDWEDVTPLLASHRTIAIDRPGFGYSTGGYVPFDRQLETIHELLAKLHIVRPILVGHSYGGTIALGFAERYPSEVRGLVLQPYEHPATIAAAVQSLSNAQISPPRDERTAHDHAAWHSQSLPRS